MCEFENKYQLITKPFLEIIERKSLDMVGLALKYPIYHLSDESKR